jgi:hypothetical protein
MSIYFLFLSVEQTVLLTTYCVRYYPNKVKSKVCREQAQVLKKLHILIQVTSLSKTEVE